MDASNSAVLGLLGTIIAVCSIQLYADELGADESMTLLGGFLCSVVFFFALIVPPSPPTTPHTHSGDSQR